jgi:hypothetical protein
MAYSGGFISLLAQFARNDVLPRQVSRVVEIGSQMINLGTEHEAVADLIKVYRPSFSTNELRNRFPISPHYYSYACEMWKTAGIDYFSYDITEAPDSRVFDLNFGSVPRNDLASADIVTNIGTTEHLINQYNAFKTIHDLLKVGGVAVHQVPFAGMLNHCLFNYHPKFFYSLIVNNRYKLRHIEYSAPALHIALGEGNTVFEGDRPKCDARIPGSDEWTNVSLFSGMITLVIERRYPDEFVPPVDFAAGYFGETTGFDIGGLVGRDDIPLSPWADAFRRKVTPSQRPEH